MILTPTIEPGIEYKNKNVTKDMPSLFDTYFWEKFFGQRIHHSYKKERVVSFR